MGNYRPSATIKHKVFEIGIHFVKMQWGLFVYKWGMYCAFIYVFIYFNIYMF